MSAFRKLELVCGIVTALLAIACFFILRPIQPEFRGSQDVLGWVLFYGLPCLVLAAGAYLHSVRRTSWGLVLILIVAVLSAVFIVASLFGGIFYWGVWTGVLALAPSIMSILTAAGGLATGFSEMPN